MDFISNCYIIVDLPFAGDYVKGLLKLPVKSFSTASYDVNPAKFPQFNVSMSSKHYK